MKSAEYDVYICCREGVGTDPARPVSAGLARRGFRVFFQDRVAGSPPDERRLRLIEETPDFVLLLTPGALDSSADEHDPIRLEIAHALRTESNVVPVLMPGHVWPPAGALPPDLAPLARRKGMAYDPDKARESIARLAHLLSSDAAVDERRLIREAKRIFWTVGLAIVALIAIEIGRALPRMLARPIDTRPLPPLALYWSAFGQRLENSRWVEFRLEDGSRILSGDQFRLVFSPSADGFAYVVTQDMRGEISVLFPPLSLEADSRVRAGELYEAPAEAGWFTVDEQSGLHSIYVLASYEPIENLEELATEPDGAMNAQARRSLLESTIAGVLDGWHAPVGRGVRTRSGRPIVQGLDVRPGPKSCSATLSSGVVVTHALTSQPGLLSAVVEIRVRYETGE